MYNKLFNEGVNPFMIRVQGYTHSVDPVACAISSFLHLHTLELHREVDSYDVGYLAFFQDNSTPYTVR